MSTLGTIEKKNKNIVELTESANSSSRESGSRPVQVWRTFVNSDPAPITPIVGFDAAFKRLSDFLIGGLALLVLLPFLALLSILIKLDSTGPALFCQQRRGRNREIIKVYKFRTMYQDFSAGSMDGGGKFKQAQKDDPRVTRIGAILRKTSLDELPQLFNVVQGSMSLVGPRPHPVPLDEKYKHVIPALNSRYAVKPGITGWAQINGFRGETVRVEDMVARVEHDRHYIKNWTLWLDIKILAMTAIKGWTHTNAY